MSELDIRGGKSVEWYTPGWVFDELGIEFDLDPCSPLSHESLVPATNKYTLLDDGLSQPWNGSVFLNPPYGRDTPQWMDKLIDHGDGIALVFSRTDTRWFQRCLCSAESVLLVAGRIQFIPGDENKHKVSRCGAASAFFAFGDRCAAALDNLRSRGFLIKLQH